MDSKIKKILGFLLILLIFSSCHKRKKVSRSFYYWKQKFSVDEKIKKTLTDLQLENMYVRYFDIQWIEEENKPYPVSKVSFDEYSIGEYSIIPVVYVENTVFTKIDSLQLNELGVKTIQLIEMISNKNKIDADEIQIDCDWTEKTKNNYFKFLSFIKQQTKYKLSATIRLHQVKYKERTGVPPVDCGVLMYYNMGKIDANEQTNSIYSAKTAALYKDYIKSYPVPLDIALGLFSWGVHTRNNKGVRLISYWNNHLISDDNHFKKYADNNYICLKDTVVNQSMIFIGDRIKIEEMTISDLNNIAQELSSEIKNDSLSVIFYHLDNYILNNYETEDLESIYNRFN